MVGCFSRLLPPSPPLPPSPCLKSNLVSFCYKKSNGLWHRRKAQLSQEGTLSLFKADEGHKVKVYDLNKPKKMIVGAGKNSLHVILTTADDKRLHLKIKDGKMKEWAERMMDLKFRKRIESSQEKSPPIDIEVEEKDSVEASEDSLTEGPTTKEDYCSQITVAEKKEPQLIKEMVSEKEEVEEDAIEYDIPVWNDGYVANMAKIFDRQNIGGTIKNKALSSEA